MSKNSSLATLARKAYIEKMQLSVLYDKPKSYADIVAKNQKGEEEYYEIKATAMTRQEYSKIGQRKTKYFGAATLSEWNVARLCPKRYIFVLVVMNKDNPEEMLDHIEWSAQDLLYYSTIPPYKINLNIPFRKPSSHDLPGTSSQCVRAFKGRKPNFDRLSCLVKNYTEVFGGKLSVPDSLKEIKDETF